MRSINDISESLRRGERITADDALKLWREAPLWLLGELATERKEKMSGKDVREKLGLRSSCFEVLTKEDSLTFITYGSGHGVGMSQYGAHGMALHGYTFDEILKHYYQGVDIVSIYE